MMLQQLQRIAKLPLILPLVMVIGFVVLFPELNPPQITFRYRVPKRCSGAVVLEIRDAKQQMIRKHKERPIGGAPLGYKARLPKGKYLLSYGMECGEEHEPDLRKQPMVVDREGVVSLDLGARCPCPEPGVVR